MAEEAEKNGADVAVEGFGAKVNVKNVKSINTILTLVAAAAASFGVYLAIQHQADAKETGQSFVGAIKEQTKALQDQTKEIQQQTAVQREGNCLMVFKDPEQCRRLTGVTR